MFAHSWVDHWLGEYTASVADGDSDGHDDHGTAKRWRPVGARLRRAAAVDELLEEGSPGGAAAAAREEEEARPRRGGTRRRRRRGRARAARTPARASHAAHTAAAVGNGIEVPESYVLAAIKEVVMHEVGYASRRDTAPHTLAQPHTRSSRSSSLSRHTLGLRHNFKGSTAYNWDQLADPAFTDAHGFGASVMDYSPPWLPSMRRCRRLRMARRGTTRRWSGSMTVMRSSMGIPRSPAR